MKTVVVGTAGHIDHGKSELVRALTGTHPDRLREERERGITIDIGFANLDLGDVVLSFVDVPGHERFIKNMLAGATGIDLVLLVVAADESVKPQTREHFHICRLLGLAKGVIALSKIDLVDSDLREIAASEIRGFVVGSFLESAPIVPVSARTGEGIPELTAVLRSAALALGTRDSGGKTRLPVDRSFTIRGFGAVVTGTLSGGSIRGGDELEVLPGGRRVRVRGLETHGAPAEIVVAGQRVALNLQGISHNEIGRGDLLASPGAYEAVSLVDARVSHLAEAPGPLRDLDRVRLHAGTAEILARARPVGGTELAQGETGYVQFRLERPAILVPGDRFVYRRYSPPTTLGGGIVVDAHPVKHRRGDREAASALVRIESEGPGGRAALLVEASGSRGMSGVDLARRVGASWETIIAALSEEIRTGAIRVLGHTGELVLSREGFETLAERARGLLGEFHAERPLLPGLPLEEFRGRLAPGLAAEAVRALLDELERGALVRIDGGLAALPEHRIVLSEEESRLSARLEEVFSTAGLNPPDPESALTMAGLSRERGGAILSYLVRRGRLRRLRDGRLFHDSAIEDLIGRLRVYRRSSETIDIAAFKDLAGVSRKHAIPLLEHLDEERVTLRRGNERVILMS